MNAERGRVFVDSMREASRLAREASESLRVCMAVLDREDPVESLVWESVRSDRAALVGLADRLEESAPDDENGY